MRLYQALYRYLQTVPAVTALVGTRVYDMHADQGRATKYPAIVIEMVDDQQFHSIGANPTGTRRPVNFYCMAQGNQKASETLADTVYSAIMGQQAAITAAAGSLTVKSTHLNGRTNDFEDALETDKRLYATILDFDFIHDL
jgi:hypothetical protein